MSWNGYEHNNLLRNEGCGDDGVPRFVDVAMALGADDQGDARGIAVADFDNDGDLDIAVNHNPGDSGRVERGRVKLLKNDIGQSRGWVAVELEGVDSNRDAVGAVVELVTTEGSQWRQVEAGSSYASQHGRRIYFGLGDAVGPARLTVRWPSGLEETVDAIEPRRLVRLREGEGVVVGDLPAAAGAG